MFNNPRYCTKGISETVPLLTQIILWDLIDIMKVEEKDYLQVFKLAATDKTQHVTHTQEQPPLPEQWAKMIFVRCFGTILSRFLLTAPKLISMLKLERICQVIFLTRLPSI